MAIGKPRDARAVIPRWHSSEATAARGELAALTTSARAVPEPSPADLALLAKKVRDWGDNKSVPFAADLLGSALVLDRPEVALDAADFVLTSGETSEAAVRLARAVLDPTSSSSGRPPAFRPADEDLVHQRIHWLRQALHRDPRNAVKWIDLALDYSVLGLDNKATKAVQHGLHLAPTNRFILRAAARFFVHVHDHQRAHEIVSRTDVTPTDPWLLATEIATAGVAKRKSKFAKRGRQVLNSGAFAPWHNSELASAIATLELESGSDRRSRQLFEMALVDPHENAAAQAEWATRRLPTLQIPDGVFEDPTSFEARARHEAEQGHWKSALSEAWEWFYDQPFSSGAPRFASYIASVCLEDYDTCIQIARAGLRANARDPILLNNLVFALASLDRVVEAATVYEENDPSIFSNEDKISFLATGGLLRYREGDIDQGRRLYRQAIDLARSLRQTEMHALALVYFAREEILHRADAEAALEQALEATRNAMRPELREWHERLRLLQPQLPR